MYIKSHTDFSKSVYFEVFIRKNNNNNNNNNNLFILLVFFIPYFACCDKIIKGPLCGLYNIHRRDYTQLQGVGQVYQFMLKDIINVCTVCTVHKHQLAFWE